MILHKLAWFAFFLVNLIFLLQARNARVAVNAVHPGIVKTGIVGAHKGFITGIVTFSAFNVAIIV